MPGGFYDLNVSADDCLSIVQNSCRLGYGTVALNFLLNCDEIVNAGKNDIEMLTQNLERNNFKGHEGVKASTRVLNRLTIKFSEPNVQRVRQVLSMELIHDFDIIALQPADRIATKACLECAPFDVLSMESLDCNTVIDKSAIKKLGIFYELSYSRAFKSNNKLKEVIAKSFSIINVLGSERRIITSGASNAKGIRSPYDVINLCHLFGMRPWETEKAITTTCRGVIQRAECRKSCLGVFTVSLIKGMTKKRKVLKRKRVESSSDDVTTKRPHISQEMADTTETKTQDIDLD